MTTASSNGNTDDSAALKGGEAGVTAVPAAFQSYLRALRSAWTDVPELTISFADLTTEVQVAATSNASGEGELPSVTRFLGEKAGALGRWLTRSDSSSQTRSFRPLEACTGIVRPGELVLVLGAPGCGKVREERNSTPLARSALPQCAALADPLRWAGLGPRSQLEEEGTATLEQTCPSMSQGIQLLPSSSFESILTFARCVALCCCPSLSAVDAAQGARWPSESGRSRGPAGAARRPALERNDRRGVRRGRTAA